MNMPTNESSASDFSKFLATETQRLAEERKAAMSEKGMSEWAKLSVGSNRLKFYPVAPRDHPVFAGKKVFKVSQDGVDKDLSISSNGKFYQDLIKALSSGKYNLDIVRTGTGRTDTRYSLVVLE